MLHSGRSKPARNRRLTDMTLSSR
eukprot:COSAG04_NODE_11296_length_718_cov_0.799677_1_plen_23_part_10